MYFNSYGQLVPDNYLAHHGIQGQKWGVQNGPPYPLSPGDHSAREVRYKGQNAGKLDNWREGTSKNTRKWGTRTDPRVKRAAKATGRYENWKAKKLSGIDKKYDRKIARIDKKIANTKDAGKLERLKSKKAQAVFEKSIKETKVSMTTEKQYTTRRKIKTALAVVGGVSAAALAATLATRAAVGSSAKKWTDIASKLQRERNTLLAELRSPNTDAVRAADIMNQLRSRPLTTDLAEAITRSADLRGWKQVYDGSNIAKKALMSGDYLARAAKSAVNQGAGAVVEAGKTAGRILAERGKNAAAVARDVGKGASGLVDDAGRTISSVAGEVGKRAGDLANKAGGAISTAAGEVSKRGGKLVDDAGRAISTAAGQASKVAGDVAKNARNVAGEVGGRIGDVVDDARRAAEIAGNRAGRIVRDVGKNAGGLIDSAGRAISTAASTASNVAGNAMKTAGKITGNISASANRFLDYVSDNAKYVMRDVTSAANKAGKSVESWTNSAFKQVENLYNSGFTPEQIAKKIGTTASTAWEMVEQLTGRK